MRIRDKKFRYLVILPSVLIVTASILTHFIRPSSKGATQQFEKQDSVSSQLFTSLEPELTYFFDLETNRGLEQSSTIVEGNALSGNHYCQLNNDNEFSVTFSKKTDEIENFKRVERVVFSFNVEAEKSDEDLLAVCSFEPTTDEGRYWVSQNVIATAGVWTKKSYTFPLPEEIRRSRGIIKIYLWNRKKRNYKIDDLTIELMTPSPKGINNSPEKGKRIFEKYITWDFESRHPGVEDMSRISNEEYISGKQSYHFDSDVIFSPTIRRNVNEVTDSELRLITAAVWIKPTVDRPDVNLVIEIKRGDGTTVFYNARSTSHSDGGFRKGDWKKLRCQFSIPENTLKPTDIISIYLWNKSESEFYADDFEVVFGDRHLRDGSPPKVRFLEVEGSRLAFNPTRGVLPTKEFVRYHIEDNQLLKPYGSGSIYAHYPQTAGRFIDNREKTDQLAVFTPGGLKLYNYCKAKNIFSLSCKPFETINYNPSTQLLSGNLDDHPDHELLFFNSAEKKLQLKRIKSPGFDNCSDKIQEATITDIPVRFNNYTLSSSAKICIGDFNNDKTDEIIITDPAGKTAVCGRLYKGALVFDKINTDFIQDESFPESEYTLTKFQSKSGDYLLVSFVKNGIFECKSFTANRELSELMEKNSKVTAHLKNLNSTILNRTIETGNSEKIIIIDREWKFDSRMIDIKTDSIFRLDFRGFSPGKNPKYYEYISLTPGRFINHQKFSIVVGSCNFDTRLADRNKIEVDLNSTLLPRFDIYTIE